MACNVVKNELGRCLESVCSLVDEMRVVDTGSVDNTKSIAFNYSAKV
ncbi:glycosyltransferase [Paenibacillus lautus]